MDYKKILQSKTFWTNVIIACVYPFLPEKLKDPAYLTYALVVVNVILDAISHGKIVLTGTSKINLTDKNK